MKSHLAVFTDPYIDLIFSGEKTIESRFSKVRCAPYGKIESGDLVYMKQSSGPILGCFNVKNVEYFEVDDIVCYNIFVRYHEEIFPNFEDEKHYIHRWLECKYATLIHVEKVLKLDSSIKIEKKDRRAWVDDYELPEMSYENIEDVQDRVAKRLMNAKQQKTNLDSVRR